MKAVTNKIPSYLSPKSQPRSARTARPDSDGFTILELSIVLAIIGLLAAISIPNMIRARSVSQVSDCVNNLKQVDSAIQQYAVENNAGIGAPVTAANITPYLGRFGTLQAVFCPADVTRKFDSSYSLSDTATKPVCLIVPATHLIQ